MTLPLQVLPTIPDNLEVMDSRHSLRYLNTFMKNTLIYGFNRIFQLSPLISGSHPAFQAFLKYVQCYCDILKSHLEGDAMFFTSAGENKKTLRDILGPHSVPKIANNEVLDSLKEIQQSIPAWSKSPASYSCSGFQNMLGFGTRMAIDMRQQVSAIDGDLLVKAISHEELQKKIKEHMEWLASRTDIAFLIPYVMSGFHNTRPATLRKRNRFVLSHHDPQTSKTWPAVTEEGLILTFELAKVHSASEFLSQIDTTVIDPGIIVGVGDLRHSTHLQRSIKRGHHNDR
ncbi:hypothetical protein BD779DRAFT_1669423 [Infundibulicybe gibba]|nr:hypothetical protein BD779DRAFT_1669423 [Infundibulicybe gibba]